MNQTPIREIQTDTLRTRVYATRAEMGAAAAKDISACIQACLAEKETITMIFAAAPSQNEVLAALAADPAIDFSRIIACHMDEYIGLDPAAPQGFGNFLKAHLFSLRPFRAVHLINGQLPAAAAIADYEKVLTENVPDITVMGIGENGHIAFNDPWVADFADPAIIKAVPLDEKCRMQQVHDGCFAKIAEVPTHALTLTVPTLVKPRHLFCIVPAASKADAVRKTLTGPISADCPASILRTRDHAELYLDADSASLL